MPSLTRFDEKVLSSFCLFFIAHTCHLGDGGRKRHVHDATLEQFRQQCDHDS